MKLLPISPARSERGTGRDALGRLVRKILTDGAKAWDLSPQVVALICIFPAIIAFTGVGAALLGKETYIWFTGEDRFAESLQVIFYILAMMMSLIIARRRWNISAGEGRAGEKLIALLYVGFSLALIFLIGEELSWGQRIFGWGTVDSLASVNKQAETNLHNVYGVGTTFKWVQMLVGAYGAILPLVVLRWPSPARFHYPGGHRYPGGHKQNGPMRGKLAEAVVPHYTLILYFLPLFIWRLFRNLLEPPKEFYFVVAEYNEVMELILAVGFFLFVIFQLRRLKRI